MEASDLLSRHLVVRQGSSKTCYFPDGSVADRHKPCGSKTRYPTCCDLDEGEECLSDGLCKKPGGDTQTLYRGSCTHEKWYGCPDVCIGRNKHDTISLKQCEAQNYCCENPSSANDCCTSSTNQFSIFNISPVPNPDSEVYVAPTGAIIGGVVGGLFVISVLIPLCWCLVRREKAAKRKLLKDELGDKSKTDFDPSLAEADAGPGSALVELDAPRKTIAEADAGPDSVLVESDSRAIKPNTIHELPA